ncbi:MAG: SoxR reducing system RseC family protein [Bacteroidales bacterium]|nr:SoxR reducing system RseC family protein [Candidatus Cryptobacteroides caccocaballi]
MKKDEISHVGKIIAITPEVTTVEIISESACSQCHARGLCGASEEVAKHIRVRTVPDSGNAVGDTVRVCLKKSLGMKAVMLSYVIPVIILMIFVVSLSVLFESDWLVGLVTLAGVAAYYGILYLMRDRLDGEYEFYIINN